MTSYLSCVRIVCQSDCLAATSMEDQPMQNSQIYFSTLELVALVKCTNLVR